nr:MAG TPA: hypothetical protein [Caudoviricetes sp.]
MVKDFQPHFLSVTYPYNTLLYHNIYPTILIRIIYFIIFFY